MDNTPLRLPNVVMFGDNETAPSGFYPVPESPLVEVAEGFVSAIINAGAYVADHIEDVAGMFLHTETQDAETEVTFRPI